MAPSAADPAAGSAEADGAPRIAKFMCNFRGSIRPSPLDRRLRYIGGDNKIVMLPRDISYSDLAARMRKLYKDADIIKYQQPDEDLDRLVSVVNDDDVVNMMEEYDMHIAAGEGFTHLRVFLFSHYPYGIMAPKFEFGSVREPAGDEDHDGPFMENENLWETTPPKRNIVLVTTPTSLSPPSQHSNTSTDDPAGPFTNATSAWHSSTPIDDGVAMCSPPDIHVPSSLETRLRDQSSTPQDIPLQELKEITDNFSDDQILGRGGCGVVYKGVLRNGETIAVKRIVSSLMPGQQKQFESEVYHLLMLRHPNVVRCVGYCYEIQNACLEFNGKYVFAETAERLLCMEYMPKGSLDKYLSDESSGLDWSTRYNIIEGICSGLCHLHVHMNKPILHLDLKPANILLDDDMVPKITDFGLSRLLDQQQTICTSSLDGTFGYMAPEFLHGGTITPKSDIFSLGVIILEVVTGHRDYPDFTTTPSNDFTELTIRKWRDVLERSPGYRSLEIDCKQIKRCIQVGLLCVNSDRTKRPPIAEVISMLHGSK